MNQITSQTRQMSYVKDVQAAQTLLSKHNTWGAIEAENVVRMRLQNRFQTGLEIAQFTADIVRSDMAAYDKDPSQYTQSLGCWHGFVAQQMVMSLKKHQESLKGKYVYLSGWMVAAMRSEFGPLPDQSMHEKTSVPNLIEEIYQFLRQADARELRHIFVALDDAREQKNAAKEKEILHKIDTYESHVIIQSN